MFDGVNSREAVSDDDNVLGSGHVLVLSKAKHESTKERKDETEHFRVSVFRAFVIGL
jgi:hypothetical protein